MWGERQGQLEGEVTFMNPKGEIKALLTDAQLPGIVALCAEALVASARDAAHIMTADIIDEQKGLSHD
jgi:hypothetical protein